MPKRKGSIQKFVTREKRDSIEKEQTQYTSGETSFLTPDHINPRVAVARVVGRGCKGRLASSRKVTSIGLKRLSDQKPFEREDFAGYQPYFAPGAKRGKRKEKVVVCVSPKGEMSTDDSAGTARFGETSSSGGTSNNAALAAIEGGDPSRSRRHWSSLQRSPHQVWYKEGHAYRQVCNPRHGLVLLRHACWEMKQW